MADLPRVKLLGAWVLNLKSSSQTLSRCPRGARVGRRPLLRGAVRGSPTMLGSVTMGRRSQMGRSA